MTTSEFSNQFDTLLNSFASQSGFGDQSSKDAIVLDEYEKSVLLTQAQDIVLKEAFNRSSNTDGKGFDDDAEKQIDFSSLVRTADLQRAEDQSTTFDDRGIMYLMPSKTRVVKEVDVFDETYDETFHLEGSNLVSDVLFILNEKLITKVNNHRKTYVVVPIHYKEYDRIMSKPYAQPFKKQAWRLFQNARTEFDFKSELIPRWNLAEKEEIVEYKIRYIRRPNPIILIKLENGMTIDGRTNITECELDPILHQEVLQKAVELAYMTHTGAVARQPEKTKS